MKTKIKILSGITLAACLFFTSCSKDEEPTVTASNFEVTIAENPSMGQSLGTIQTSITGANNMRYYLLEGYGLAENININSNTGEVTISAPSYFDYEQQISHTTNAAVEVYNSSDEMASATYTITINLTDVVEVPAPTVSVQERLDLGESPIDIYISNSALLDSLYGKTYAGGLIAYLNTTTGNGFVVASNDQSTALIWDPNQPAGSGTVGTNDAIGNGPSNTINIVTTIGVGSYAAQICNDLTLSGYSDWFLPCKDELAEIYTNLHTNGYGNFQNISYWSSSEATTATIVWYHKFDTGQIGQGGSEQLFGVRATRTF